MTGKGNIETKSTFHKVAVYRRIEEDLRSRVRKGVWPIGSMVPSRRDLAKEYSVDERTLQRAIAGLLADGTLRADGGRGTFVNSAAADMVPARPIHATKAKTIALIFDQCSALAYPSTQANLRGIYRTFSAHAGDHRILTFATHGDTWEQAVSLEMRALNAVETEGVDGAIICHSGDPRSTALVSRMIDNGIPLVFVDRCPPGIACHMIGVENSQGGSEAVNYLLSLGHRRIAMLTTSMKLSTIDERLSGYLQAHRTAGIEPAGELIQTLDFSPNLKQSIRNAIEHFRALPEPPTALFAVNDNIAHQFITEAEACGWSVPGDISVVGFDDIEQFSPRNPFLTTIHQPFELIGAYAAELLLQNIEKKKEGARTFQKVLLPTKLIARSSCRAL